MTGPARCAQLSIEVGESPQASAPTALAWLAIEQGGPWGRDALTGSRLDPDLGRELALRAKASQVRLALIRPALRRRTALDGHQVVVAYTQPGREWLRTWRVDDPRALLDLDLDRIAGGTAPPVGEVSDDALMLVCTNAKRDSCCARNGVPLAKALASRHPGQVWQCSHLGGHRFAPTAALLPSGYLYGRLSLDQAELVLAAAGRHQLPQPAMANLRGRSTWTPEGQLAEIAVRQRIGEFDTRALAVTTVPHASTVRVSHVDGRAWMVDLRSDTDSVRPRPESCGRTELPVRQLRATRIENA